MKNKLVVANWKMNCTLKEAKNLLKLCSNIQELTSTKVVICPPSVYFESARRILKGGDIKLGSQNISEYNPGAFTGELSTDMLEEFNCEYVILGHSERRSLFNESSEVIAAKFAKAVSANLKPVLCIGENEQQRSSGITKEILAEQLSMIIKAVGLKVFNNAIIAYEPIWAIGTGKTATTNMIAETSNDIKQYLQRTIPSIANSITLLYGGSVNNNNAHEIFALPQVDGGLIGGASLNYQQFLAICHAAEQSSTPHHN